MLNSYKLEQLYNINYVRAWRKICDAETIKFQDLSWNFSFQAIYLSHGNYKSVFKIDVVQIFDLVQLSSGYNFAVLPLVQWGDVSAEME